MPTNASNNETRIREFTSDQNLVRLAKRVAVAYGNENVRLLSAREVDKAKDLYDIDAVNKVIANVPQMSAGQRLDFCDAFVGEDMSGLDLATPMILGEAYRAIASRVRDGDTDQQERLDKLAARIDDLSADFANSGGMVVSRNEWPLVDLGNIADVYEGFGNMLDARMADIDATKYPEKYSEMQANKQQIETVVSDYDSVWGLAKLRGENAEKLAERWDELYGALNRADLSEETKEKLAKYKFLDAKDQVIPQFVSGKRGDTKKYEEYEPGFRIVKDGRLASVVELARHDVAKKHVAEFNTDVDEDALEIELNDAVLTKLFEIDVADKIVQGATENPKLFADPKYREEFIERLAQTGGEISDTGYNAAIDAQTNATAGWAARVKNKLGAASQKVGGFFGKVFQPIKHIDKMADVRMTRRSVSKREKRIELFTRILKGFASAAIASALITTIATAAAAAAGMSVAMTLAAISIVTAIGMGTIQVMRWRKAQQEAGLPTDVNEFLKDARLVASLGASLLAVVAMCFGAAGMATAAKWLGVGALGLGGVNNATAAYVDARDTKMSVAESIAWAIANAGSVIAGGFAGRALAHMGINAYNKAHSHNTEFQNATPNVEQQETTTTREITETRTEYTQDALDNAERIARMWYRDNPDILQQRVDAINAYNAEHGTNIDPYRAIMINGDAGGRTFDNMRLHINNSRIDQNINDVYSHGQHRVLTDAWGRANGFTHDELNAARHLFARDGSINPAGMDAIAKLDNMISDTNTVGYVDNRPVHTDNYFKPNDPKGWTTYTGGNAPKVENTYTSTETITTTKPVEYIDYTPTKGDGVAMFGNYTPRERKTQLRDRLGSFVDRVRHGLRPDKSPKDDMSVVKQEEPIVPPIVEDEQRDEYLPATESTVQQDEFIPVKDELENQDIFTAPVKEETDGLPPFDLSEENDEPDERLGEHVRPAMGSRPLGNLFPKPVFKDTESHLRRLRNAHEKEPSNHDKTPVALLTEGQTKFKPFTEPSFAMTPEQVARWEDLHQQMSNIRAKRKSPSVRAGDFLKYRNQEYKIEKEIDAFYNQLGRPSTIELNQALAEAHRREKLQQYMKELERHMQKKPTGDAKDWQIMKWVEERNKILQKIEDYGGMDSLDDTNLRFAAPTNVERRQKMQDERLKDASVINRGFKIRTGDSVNVDLLPDTGIGVPITLFCMDADLQTPLMRNGNQIAVVADIDGIRVPFVLAGNDSKANKTPGKWYPMLGLDSTIGQPLFRDWGVMSSETVKELFEKIGKELDTRFGDVRKDINKIQEFNRETFFHIMDSEGNTYKKYFVWGPMGGGQLLSVNDMRKYLDGLEEIYHQDNLRPGERFLRGISQVVTGARERGLLPNRRLFKRWRE